MTIKGLAKSLTAAQKSLDLLNEALEMLKKDSPDSKYRSLYIDSIIKRYEVLFEYTWKLFKVAIDYQGGEAPGPRPAIQEAIRFGWIKDPEFWALAIDARNGSVHDYFGITHDEYLEIIRRFAKETEKIMEKLKKLT